MFNHPVVSDSLQPRESQHARPACPSPTPGAYSNSCPSSQWCHPAISSSVVPFSSCPQIPPSIRVLSHESALHIRGPKDWSFEWALHSQTVYFISLVCENVYLQTLRFPEASKLCIILKIPMFEFQWMLTTPCMLSFSLSSLPFQPPWSLCLPEKPLYTSKEKEHLSL